MKIKKIRYGIIVMISLMNMAGKAQITVQDIEGNSYKTVSIGHQVWMAENLKATKYNDGTPIPNVVDNTKWGSLTTPAYCWYNNQAINKTTYGALYNWYVISPTKNGNKNVCPKGWHVPTQKEWTELTNYLGGESIASSKLRESGTTTWESPNEGATNESGFTALPGGYRRSGFNEAEYESIGYLGIWWSSTEDVIYKNAWRISMGYKVSYTNGTSISESQGYSIRCFKGN
jgi:uncharacterized protein (TIGR02145 family)